jgi:hypothetical protein
VPSARGLRLGYSCEMSGGIIRQHERFRGIHEMREIREIL